MPFTPFHFGPGLLLKAAAPRRLSLLAFCTTQVAIDLESWYHLTNDEAHVHRILHTFVFGTLVGLAVAALVWICHAGVHALIGRRGGNLSIGRPVPILAAEVSLRSVILGGALGGLTHTLLDAVMHRDMQPLRPFTLDNPLLGLVGLNLLHNACIAAGAIGAMVLVLRRGQWGST